MSVDVKVVTLPVTVRDKHGQIIRNLTKEDFVLEEDGHGKRFVILRKKLSSPSRSACWSTPA
jgi:hypothetical protein